MEIVFDLMLSDFGYELQTFIKNQRTKTSKGQIKSCPDSRITLILTIISGAIAETCDTLEHVSNLNLAFIDFETISPGCLLINN